MTRYLTLGIVIGFVAGFASCLTWVQVTRRAELAEAFARGREARDAEAYRNLHPLADMRVTEVIQPSRLYKMEPTEGGRIFQVRWCEPLYLERDWIIRGAVTELRHTTGQDDCLSLQMGKAEIKIDRVTTLVNLGGYDGN